MITVDVVIVLDCTASMQEWIDAARNTALESFQALQTIHPDATFRLGAVCYRDFGDQEQHIIIPLSTEWNIVQDRLKTIHALGGNDEAEDVAGALHHAINMSWDATIKMILMVTDAPPHGKEYHDITISDRYPKGDPPGRKPRAQVKLLAEQGIDLTVFRINPSINTMIRIFEESYQGTNATFTVLDVENQTIHLEHVVVDDNVPVPVEPHSPDMMMPRARRRLNFDDLEAQTQAEPMYGASAEMFQSPSDISFRTGLIRTVNQSISRSTPASLK